MDWALIPLWFSIVCACVLNIPQLVHTYRSHAVASLSRATMGLRVLSSGSWIAYAVLTSNVLIGVSSSVVFVSELSLLAMKYRWDA